MFSSVRFFPSFLTTLLISHLLIPTGRTLRTTNHFRGLDLQ
jgi:hypothetical protein